MRTTMEICFVFLVLRSLLSRYLAYNIIELIFHLLPYVAWAGERALLFPLYTSDHYISVFSAYRVHALANRCLFLTLAVFFLGVVFIIPNIIVREQLQVIPLRTSCFKIFQDAVFQIKSITDVNNLNYLSFLNGTGFSVR